MIYPAKGSQSKEDSRQSICFASVVAYLLFLAVPSSGLAWNSPAVVWTNFLGSGSDCCPAIGGDGTIYTGTFDGHLVAINADGSTKWTFTTGRGGSLGMEIWSSPAVGPDGTIYFGCRDRKLYALHANGRKAWEFRTDGWVDSSPALASDGTVCFGSWDRKFYALNPNGSLKWQFSTGGEIVSSAAIGADGTVYFGSHDKNFYALEPDGRKKWAFATGGPIISSPALTADQGVLFASVDGWLYALHADGSLRWRIHTGGSTQSSPAIGSDGTIFVGVNDQLCAISSDGKTNALVGSDKFPIEATPAIFSNGSVCSISRLGYLINFARDQDQKWILQWGIFLGAYGYASPAVGPDGMIYAPTGTELSAMQTNAPLARTIWPKFRANARNTGNVRD